MSLNLAITPGGHLRLEDDADALPVVDPAAAAKLQAAFERSAGEGLLLLASQQLDQELPATLVFWRGVARHCFQAICKLGEAAIDQWRSVEPSADLLRGLVEEAPPMRGLEYLSVDLL